MLFAFGFCIDAIAYSPEGSLVLTAGGYVSVDSLPGSDQSISVEAWVYSESWTNAADGTILSLNSGDTWEILVLDKHLNLKVVMQSGTCVLQHSLMEMPAGWHHLLFSMDDKYIRFYVDGAQRDYFYSAAGFDVITAGSGLLNVGCKTNNADLISSGWDGKLDEVRCWSKALSSSEITQNMHHTFQSGNLSAIESLIFVAGFDDISFTALKGTDLSPISLSSRLNCSIEEKSAVVGSLRNDYAFDAEGYWSLYGAGIYSESSAGMHLAITNGNLLELDESIVYGQNGKMGIAHATEYADLDFIARKIWFLQKDCDYESFMFRFDMSDAEAIGILDECLSYNNYKLLFKKESEDTFEIISEAYMLDGDNLYFKDVQAKDGFYTLGRDNELPAVKTDALTDIGSNIATGGGEVMCDGGTPVSKYGLCWSLSSFPTIADSMSMIGNGLGEFTTQIENLVPGCTYYVRAYAINQEGVAYGDEMIIRTNKLNQSVVFPSIDPKPFGSETFDPGAYASSGLPIHYRSSNEAVARIIDGMIQITGVGSTAIWADQPGNISYNPSAFRKATLTVTKSGQQIIGAKDISLTYGDTLFLNEIKASSGLPLTIDITDSTLFKFTENAIVAAKIGETTCSVVQPGNANYLASSEVFFNIAIQKKDLRISFICDTIVYDGKEKNALAICDQDSLKVIVTYNECFEAPVMAGTYKVRAMIDDDYFAGADSIILLIEKAEPIIFNWPTANEIFEGQALSASTLFDGNANVPGQFMFRNNDLVPSFSGEDVNVVFYPEDTLNYMETSALIPVYFGIVTRNENLKSNDLKIYPSVGNGQLSIEAGDQEWSYKVFSLSGSLLYQMSGVKGKSQHNLSFLGKGIFTIVGECGDECVVRRISIM